eukprot:5716401-Amphidinium_carterae.1
MRTAADPSQCAASNHTSHGVRRHFAAGSDIAATCAVDIGSLPLPPGVPSDHSCRQCTSNPSPPACKVAA